MLLVGKTLAQ